MPEHDTHQPDSLNAEIEAMRRFDVALKYYAITLTANRRGRVTVSTQTHWVEWSPRGKNWEIRRASLVKPDVMSSLWERIDQSWVSVHSGIHLGIYYRIGGNALVESTFAEAHLAHMIAPSEVMHDASIEVGGFGFLATDHLPDEAATNRAPSRKLRGFVLKRDDYRCVICGRRATDHVDIELHVHHLVPWRMGGPTAEENLVTLCGACHKGLDPDYEPKLRAMAMLPGPSRPLDTGGIEFNEDVARYQKRVSEYLR